jgi:LPS O-antigen subunit length determinant protein (WzzB/FepE family)
MEEKKSDLEYLQYDEIDIGNIVEIILKEKIKLAVITSIFAISTVFLALSLPNIYTSQAMLAPANAKPSMSSSLSGMSSLAGLAGINIPMDDSANKSLEAIERIKSYQFFVTRFLPNIRLENLIAIKSWDPETNIIEYNNLFDSSTGKWNKNSRFKSGKPSSQEAFKIYSKNIELITTKKNSFVRISISHQSPMIAKEWLDLIIKNINQVMQDEDKKLLEDSVSFLSSISEQNNLKAVDKAINNLLEAQIQNLMLATSNPDYVYKILNSPIAPEEKSSPQRSIICIVGTFIGFIFGIIIILFLNLRKNISD